MEQNVHLLQGFLHMLHVSGRIAQQHRPLTEIATQDAGWTEGTIEQSIGVQSLCANILGTTDLQ